MEQALGEQRAVARGARHLAAEPVELVARRGRGRGGRTRRRPAGVDSVWAEGTISRPNGGGSPSRRTPSPIPVIRQRSGTSWLGTSAPRPAAIRLQRARRSVPARRGGEPQRGGGVGRPAAHARRDRDALGDREAHGRAVPAGLRAEAGERAAARFSPSTPGQTTSSASRVRRGSSSSSSASDSGCTRDTSGWYPSARGRPTNRHRLTFPGARQRSALHARASAWSARHSAGRELLGARVRRAADRRRARRVRGRGSPARRRGRARATARAPCGGARSPAARARAAPARAPGRGGSGRRGRSRRSARGGRRYGRRGAGRGRRRRAARAREGTP